MDASSKRKPFLYLTLALVASLYALWFQVGLCKQFATPSVEFHAELSDPGWSIFYNVYIPTDQGDKGKTNALRIIQEQLEQIGGSYAASIPFKPVTIFYNTIGDSVDHDVLDQWTTDNMRLIHMNHYTEGFEDVTLTKLHDFCQANPSSKVVYMHTKGSYHNHGRTNENWRFSLTQAALHRDCLHPPNATCNLCGLQFFPVWGTFIAGNMWAADCSYVQQLLPPLEYQGRIAQVAETLENYRKRGLLQTKLFDANQEDKLCQGRYAMECWVGSHPRVMPCDLSSQVLLSFWSNHDRRSRLKEDTNLFHFAMAPRRGVHAPWFAMDQGTKRKILWSSTNRVREYYFLAGNLLRWLTLYDEVPPRSSWAWEWFPDGKYWQHQAARYGGRVVEVVTERFRKRAMKRKEESQQAEVSRDS